MAKDRLSAASKSNFTKWVFLAAGQVDLCLVEVGQVDLYQVAADLPREAFLAAGQAGFYQAAADLLLEALE